MQTLNTSNSLLAVVCEQLDDAANMFLLIVSGSIKSEMVGSSSIIRQAASVEAKVGWYSARGSASDDQHQDHFLQAGSVDDHQHIAVGTPCTRPSLWSADQYVGF